MHRRLFTLHLGREHRYALTITTRRGSGMTPNVRQVRFGVAIRPPADAFEPRVTTSTE